LGNIHHLWRLNLARELRIVLALTDRRIAAERVNLSSGSASFSVSASVAVWHWQAAALLPGSVTQPPDGSPL
jgi:hypothetical protein